MVRTFLKVYMELGSSFLFLQEQIKDIIIMPTLNPFSGILNASCSSADKQSLSEGVSSYGSKARRLTQ
jgi:hypothetical protein